MGNEHGGGPILLQVQSWQRRDLGRPLVIYGKINNLVAYIIQLR
jgi:hypothetical protein